MAPPFNQWQWRIGGSEHTIMGYTNAYGENMVPLLEATNTDVHELKWTEIEGTDPESAHTDTQPYEINDDVKSAFRVMCASGNTLLRRRLGSDHLSTFKAHLPFDYFTDKDDTILWYLYVTSWNVLIAADSSTGIDETSASSSCWRYPRSVRAIDHILPDDPLWGSIKELQVVKSRDVKTQVHVICNPIELTSVRLENGPYNPLVGIASNPSITQMVLTILEIGIRIALCGMNQPAMRGATDAAPQLSMVLARSLLTHTIATAKSADIISRQGTTVIHAAGVSVHLPCWYLSSATGGVGSVLRVPNIDIYKNTKRAASTKYFVSRATLQSDPTDNPPHYKEVLCTAAAEALLATAGMNSDNPGWIATSMIVPNKANVTKCHLTSYAERVCYTHAINQAILTHAFIRGVKLAYCDQNIAFGGSSSVYLFALLLQCLTAKAAMCLYLVEPHAMKIVVLDSVNRREIIIEPFFTPDPADSPTFETFLKKHARSFISDNVAYVISGAKKKQNGWEFAYTRYGADPAPKTVSVRGWPKLKLRKDNIYIASVQFTGSCRQTVEINEHGAYCEMLFAEADLDFTYRPLAPKSDVLDYWYTALKTGVDEWIDTCFDDPDDEMLTQLNHLIEVLGERHQHYSNTDVELVSALFPDMCAGCAQ